jgi:3-oxoacyl-[acyl-carrier protein] reductase
MSDNPPTVLVTGAGRGIGAAICRRLAADGARIIAVARTRPELDALLTELTPHRADCVAVPTDLSKPEDITALVGEVRTRVGRLDVLVNNAGIAWGRPLGQTTLEAWRELMAIDLDAVFLLTRDFLPLLKESGRGQIINIGSDASIRGIPGMSCYCAAKFALRGFTLALRQEFIGTGLRVNLVMPGPVNTTIIAKTANRADLIQPEDVAEVVRELVVLPRRADVWEILIEPGDRPKTTQ